MKAGEVYKHLDNYRKIVCIKENIIYYLFLYLEDGQLGVSEDTIERFKYYTLIDKVPPKYEEKEYTVYISEQDLCEGLKFKEYTYSTASKEGPVFDDIKFTGITRKELNFNWETGDWE